MSPSDGGTIEVSIPCEPRYLSTVRLAVAGAASLAGLSVEEADDVKVAVSEACTNVLDHAFPPDQDASQYCIRVRMSIKEGELRVEVEDEGEGFDPKRLPRLSPEERVEQEGGLGLFLMQGLMDEVKVQSAPGSGTKVTMVKRPAR